MESRIYLSRAGAAVLATRVIRPIGAPQFYAVEQWDITEQVGRMLEASNPPAEPLPEIEREPVACSAGNGREH